MSAIGSSNALLPMSVVTSSVMGMDRHPLTDELAHLAAVTDSTIEELLDQARGTTPALTPQAHALHAGWASADLAAEESLP